MTLKDVAVLKNEKIDDAIEASKKLEEKIKKLGLNLLPSEKLKKGTIVFILGGDGTVLRMAKALMDKDVFLIGINFGHLGFLSPYDFKDIDDVIKKVLIDEKFTIVNRHLAKVNGKFGKRFFFNEFVIQRDVPSHMIEIEVKIDDSKMGNVKCDGMIISTSTGSTAYNLSANGPIIDPSSDVLSIVPMMAHTFFKAPVVVSSQRTVSLKIKPRDDERYLAVSDGNVIADYKDIEKFEISSSEKVLKFICTMDRDFFKLVHQKLGWGVRNGNEYGYEF